MPGTTKRLLPTVIERTDERSEYLPAVQRILTVGRYACIQKAGDTFCGLEVVIDDVFVEIIY